MEEVVELYIQEFPEDLPELPHHRHTNTDTGESYLCNDYSCNIWFWQDKRVKALIPVRFKKWVGKDLIKGIAAMQVGLDEKLSTETGKILTIFGYKIQLKKLLSSKITQLVILIISGVAIGFSSDMIVEIFK